jgi:HSP20 family protein
MNQLFRELQDDVGDLWGSHGRALPALNLWDDDARVFVEAEVPGYKMDDLEISVIGNELTITGRRELETAEGTTFHRRERRTGEFTRSLTLPVEIDAEKVQATLKDGILTVELPKAQAALPRKIEVKSA